MRKRIFVVLMILLFCFFVSACTSKLTTVRPTLITRIAVEQVDTGSKTELNRKSNAETDWLMDNLVFQMEQRYRVEGSCEETDDHRYHAQYYMDDKLELSVYINGDGSICKNGRRHFQYQQKQGDSSRPVDLDQWSKCFERIEIE